MTTGQKIIKRELLTEEEADQVCGNLIQLSETGVWEIPTWAAELAQHYDIAEAHVVIQLAGWQASASAYKARSGAPMEVKPDAKKVISNMLATMIAQERRETGEFHWSAEAFKPIWDEAKEQAKTWLEQQQ